MDLVYVGRRLMRGGTLSHVYHRADALADPSAYLAFKAPLARPAVIGWRVTVSTEDDQRYRVEGKSGPDPSMADAVRGWAADEAADLTAHAAERQARRAAEDARDLSALTMAEARSLYLGKRTAADRAAVLALIIREVTAG